MGKKENNLLMGTLMAILFGLIGCGIWGLMYYFGIIAGLAAYFIVFLAGIGYKKFGKIKHLNVKDYVILAVISVVELTLTFFICYGILISNTYAKEGVDISFFAAIGELFNLVKISAELKAALIQDILVSLLFLVLGIVFYVVAEKRAKKLEEQKQVLTNIQKEAEILNMNTMNAKPENVKTDSLEEKLKDDENKLNENK